MDHSIEQKSKELTSEALSLRETSQRISDFVQNKILYYLDEWDVDPVDVFQKGRGMCAGKALLAVELHRAVKIPARFKIVKIHAGNDLFQFIAHRLEEMECPDFSLEDRRRVVHSILSLPRERDHILVQALLNGEWADLDIARDRNLDYGMRFLGIGEERRVISEEGPFDSIDEWLKERMKQRALLKGREIAFRAINGQIERVRLAGTMALKGGVRASSPKEIKELFSKLEVVPMYPLNLGSPSTKRLDELTQFTQSFLISLYDREKRSSIEEELVDWLFALVRHNVKRGRVWDLFDVLSQRRADCLGYAQLFTILAKDFGLDAGVIEVLRDSRGSYVPHVICMVRLANGRKRLVDPWYGSSDIRHRLVVVRVKQRGKLILKSLTMKGLESASEILGLSREQICGIEFYILGNFFFDRGMKDEAIDCYDLSIWLYPSHPRALFNRAVALESMGREESAKEDYQRVFSMKQSLPRILGNINEIEQLIELDEEKLDDFDQQVYLLRRGFVTGHREPWKEISKGLNSPLSVIRKKWNQVSKCLIPLSVLGSSTENLDHPSRKPR